MIPGRYNNRKIKARSSILLGPVTGTIPFDPTFGSFTFLELVSHQVNRFLWWKCLDCLNWNRCFFGVQSVDTVGIGYVIWEFILIFFITFLPVIYVRKCSRSGVFPKYAPTQGGAKFIWEDPTLRALPTLLLSFWMHSIGKCGLRAYGPFGLAA